jgi:hypothetical protein
MEMSRPIALFLLVLAASLPPTGGQPVPQASVSAEPGPRIQPPPPNYQFPDGRRYVFTVEWHLFTAGTATVVMEHDGANQKVTAIANSQGVVNTLYNVHDNFESHFDPHSFCSLQISKHSEEGPHKRETEIHFEYPRHVSILDEKNLKTGEIKHTENEIPSCVTDVITGFYYLASLPLQTASSYSFIVNDGGKTAEVNARVEGHEHIKVPAGSFQAIRVSGEAITGTLKGKGRIWVWFTDDASRLPVQMRAKLRWGTLLFRLSRVEQL